MNREPVSSQNIDRNANGKGGEGAEIDGAQLSESGGEADGEKAEYKSPAPKGSDGSQKVGFDGGFKLLRGDAAGDQGDQQGGDKKADDELGKPPPDLSDVHPAFALVGVIPHRGGNKGPDQ